MGRFTPRMTQPAAMKTRAYTYGIDQVNGNDAWGLFVACAANDVSRVRFLLAKDRRLANAQFWYQFPIHMAVREGNTNIVKLLLDGGADPGQSRFTYNSWDRLSGIARQRGHHEVESLLKRVMTKKFNFSPDFDVLKDAILARNSRKISTILRRRPKLATASDALGNNALHWSVITRQLGLIERFVELSTPIDAQRADGQTPVLLAINGASDYWYRGTRGRTHPSMRNAWVMVGHLLANGATYSISVAAAVGDQHRVEQLLKKNVGLARRRDGSRVSPLSYASREGYAHIAQLLLEHGADPNLPEELAPQGRALFEACAGNHVELPKLLLERGANPNAGVDSCGCCLSIVKHFHPQTYKPLQTLLRDHGAFTPPYEMSVKEMKQAIHNGHEVIRDEEFLGELMDKNDSSLLDDFLEHDPSVPKRMQVYGGIAYPKSPAMVRKLLAHGLDPNRPDWLGKTFLHACAENGDRTVATIFLDAGANINARDVEFKGTPLAATVRYEPQCDEVERPKLEKRQARMVRFLLKRGAATSLPGDPPWATPLAWARKRGLAEIEAILAQHGART